jgi:hypothetical protein
MSKGRGRGPRKPRTADHEIENEPNESVELVRQEPPRSELGSVAERQRAVITQVVDVVRNAAGALVDFADRVAETIRRRIEGRA